MTYYYTINTAKAVVVHASTSQTREACKAETLSRQTGDTHIVLTTIPADVAIF